MNEIYDASEESAEDVKALRSRIAATDPLLQPNTPEPRKGRRTQTRRLAWAGGALVGLIAAAFVLLPGGGTERELPLIRLNGDMTAGAPMAANDAAVGEGAKMIAPWNPQFELGPDAELEGSKGGVHRVNTPTPDRVKQLFARLMPGVDVEEVPAAEGGGWRTPWQDGSANMYVSAGGYWSYSAAYTQTAVVCAEPLDGDEADASCGVTQQPSNLPDGAAAIELTSELVSDLGLGNGEIILAYEDDWGVSIEWRPDLNEIDLGNNANTLSSWFNYGEDSELTYAGGQLIDLDYIGDYPTIDSARALTEAYPTNSMTAMPAIDCVQPMPAETGQVVKGADGASYPETTTDQPTEDGIEPAVEPTAQPAVDPAVDPVVDPYYPCGGEPTPVKLIKARRIHTVLWDAQSSLWIVPAYEYTSEDGSTWTATALDPSYIERGGEDSPAEPVADEPGTAASPDQSGGSTGGWTGADSLIGMSEEDALRAADSAQIPARVIERDGEPQMTTKDYLPGRLNLVVKNDTVIGVNVE